jgi:hypothetical protein
MEKWLLLNKLFWKFVNKNLRERFDRPTIFARSHEERPSWGRI